MARELISPDHSDAPADVEELLESNLLNRQLYPCEACENPISVLIGVRQLMADEPLEEGAMPDAGLTETAKLIGGSLSSPRRRGLGQGVRRSPN